MSLEPRELLELRKALDYASIALVSKVDKNDIAKYEVMRATFQIGEEMSCFGIPAITAGKPCYSV